METVDFYRSLGCKRLGDLLQEDLRGTEEATDSDIARSVRSLILERLPLFFQHHGDVTDFAWLNDEENFIVRAFRKLSVTRSIDFGGAKSSISIDPSAAANLQGEVGEELWLAANVEVDMYEVAASLFRLIFDAHKVNDVFLFAMILSTDLDTLQRRGYNGDYEVPSFLTLLTRFL